MKRRIFCLVLCLTLVFGLALSVRAETVATGIQIYASVNTDGDADVTMNVQLRIDSPVENLMFPLPMGASNVTVNDGSVNTTRGANAILVDMSGALRNKTGDFKYTFKFKLKGVVSMVEEKLTLNLPLLSGFDYPVNSVSISIMLPSEVQSRPVFKSTYYQDSIDTILDVTVSGNTVNGLITQQLKDRETLSMTMVVPESMFGGVSTYVRVGNPEIVPMAVCAVLALLYWLLFLRGFPLLKVHRATPPEGVTAGELSTRLTLGSPELTMMVLTWAQLGYIMIHLDDNGRVMLHKRMEMGNERSSFEVKIFNALFGKRRSIDGTGYQYAQLARRVAATTPGKKSLLNPKSGNMKIFRGLSCGVQVFCGLCYAMNLTGMLALQVILGITLAALGAAGAWLIQEGMYRVHLRYKLPLILSLGISVVWVLLGLYCGGQWIVGLCSVAAQLLCGLAAAYGGRRTDLGRQNACQILGFRKFLKNLSKEDLQRIQANDPEYFFNTVPYAMALGVGKAFARCFGKKKLTPCPYFTCGISGKLTAEDWYQFLYETAEILDSRQRRMAWEKYAIIHIGR